MPYTARLRVAVSATGSSPLATTTSFTSCSGGGRARSASGWGVPGPVTASLACATSLTRRSTSVCSDRTLDRTDLVGGRRRLLRIVDRPAAAPARSASRGRAAARAAAVPVAQGGQHPGPLGLAEREDRALRGQGGQLALQPLQGARPARDWWSAPRRRRSRTRCPPAPAIHPPGPRRPCTRALRGGGELRRRRAPRPWPRRGVSSRPCQASSRRFSTAARSLTMATIPKPLRPAEGITTRRMSRVKVRLKDRNSRTGEEELDTVTWMNTRTRPG